MTRDFPVLLARDIPVFVGVAFIACLLYMYCTKTWKTINMDELCGLGSLQVVYHKFSDGVQVVRCVLDFFKSVADVELSYSQSIGRLVRSSAYTFHSNILMQWLGSEPYEEIGTVKRCWQQLGTELSVLVDHHASKAEGYLTPVRIQLQTLLPQLEDMRMKLKNKIQQLRTSVEVAEKVHSKEKAKYCQMGDTCIKLRGRLDGIEGQSGAGVIRTKMTEHKEAVLTRDFELQEKTYRASYEALVKTYQNFNKDIQELYREVEQAERDRVKTLKESLHQFTKTLSNTAPVYLESMGKIVLCVDEIDASSDIASFVAAQTQLTEKLVPPDFEQHQAVTLPLPPPKTDAILTNTPTHTETDSMLNGNRTPSLRSQRSVSNESQDSDTKETKPHSPQAKRASSSKEAAAQIPSKKPSVKPKPPLKSSTSSEASVVTSSSQSLGHITSSSDQVTSSSSHVGQVIERMESESESKVTPPRHRRSKQRVVLPSVSSMEHTNRSRTHSHPSPKTTPSLPRRLSGHTSYSGDIGATLEQLRRLALTNDCYALLGVQSSATLEELTRARREKSRLLHPDHFAGQPDRKRRAEEQLSLINQIFQDILKTPEKRELYDRLCHFRKFYERIPEQDKGLDKAREKLEDHARKMKKAQFPLSLLDEASLAVQLVNQRQASISQDNT